MDKNTILAVVLSVIVITIGMTIQSMFYTPTVTTEQTATDNTSVQAEELAPSENTYVSSNLSYGSGVKGSFKPVDDSNADKMPFQYETGVFQVVFDPAGASVSSIKLKEHKENNGDMVDLVFNGEDGKDAFLMYGGQDKTTPIDAVFNHRIEGNKVIFTQDFVIEGSKDPFTITKTYTFGGESEYLFEINIDIQNSVNKAIPLSFDNEAYTLAYEPQIGPEFVTMPQDQYEYRHFYVKNDGSKKKSLINMKNGKYTSEKTISWVALVGKYFSMIAIPDATNYTLSLEEHSDSDSDVPFKSAMYFTRPSAKSAHISDTFRFYAGPQLKKCMTIYDHAEDNSFGATGLNLEAALDSSSWLGWLENFLMLLLTLFYKIIPNYGIGIILVTFLLKAVLYPVTKKGMDNTAKMSSLGPKMEEIKSKYPDNPQKQNELMAALYKKEKINPMSGCLPMLIQFPILIAFFGLLNKHFELRGAMFIPGWIPDLSQPDTVLTFGFKIPFLGNQLHLLPIIYTVSMIYSMKITQNSSTGGSQQGMMKFMTYGMPAIFFFMLYNSPSGLMLYWTVMNAISIVQQLFTNAKQKKQKKSATVVKATPVTNKKKK